jgi:hypothetical protein
MDLFDCLLIHSRKQAEERIVRAFCKERDFVFTFNSYFKDLQPQPQLRFNQGALAECLEISIASVLTERAGH